MSTELEKSGDSGNLLDPNVTGIVNMDMTKKDLVEMVEVDTLQKINTRRKQINARLAEIQKDYGDNYWAAMKVLDEKEKAKLLAEYVPKFEAIIGKVIRADMTCRWKRKEKDRCYATIDVYINGQHIQHEAAKPIGAFHELTIGTGAFQGSLTIPATKEYFKGALKEWQKRLVVLNEANVLTQELEELKETEKELPTKLKAFSAALSKKALGSSAKGVQVLKLLNDLHNSVKV
jgi:hypothetical protein